MLIKDIRSTGSFPTNMERMPGSLAMLYGFSVAACLSSATSEEGGMGLGACVRACVRAFRCDGCLWRAMQCPSNANLFLATTCW